MFHETESLLATMVGWLGNVIFSAGLWITLLPVLFHAIDKTVERSSPFSEKRLRAFMQASPQKPVRQISNNEHAFSALLAYFEFEKACHLVIGLLLFDALACYGAEVECTGTFWRIRLLPFVMIVGLLGALAIFMVRLAHDQFTPERARPRATIKWEFCARGALAAVLLYDCWLRLSCEPTGHGLR